MINATHAGRDAHAGGAAAQHSRDRLRQRDSRSERRLSCSGRCRKEVPGKLQMWDVVQHLDKRVAGRRHHHQRRRQLHRLGASLPSLSRLPHAARADLRRDGLRRAGGDRARKRCIRNRTVVCFAGDGCFLMTGQELATAVQHQLPIVIIVVNNGMYGTIRMHQEREYPGARSRHDAGEPGFRRLRACIRCARRSGRDHGAVRAGLRARTAGGQAGVARAAASIPKRFHRMRR